MNPKRACPRCHGWKDTRQVRTERGYGNLEKFVCDACEIAWYLQPGSTTGSFGRFLSPEVAKLAMKSAKAAYRPHKPPKGKYTGRQRAGKVATY